MFVVIKDICSSINDKDNVIPKGIKIFEELIKPFGNGVFVDGAGIYVDDLIFASSVKRIGDKKHGRIESERHKKTNKRYKRTRTKSR